MRILLTTNHDAGRRLGARWAAVVAMAVMLLTGMLAAAPAFPAAAAEQVGVKGHSYDGFSASTGGAITGEKPESKLWFAQGSWWAAMLSPARSGAHTIHRMQSGSWVDTGVVIDDRPATKEDVLAVGDRLYIVSRAPGGQGGNRLRRFTYASGSYRLDSGFPVDVPGGGAETTTLARDTTGTLWITYEAGNEARVARSQGSDTSWGQPYRLPVAGSGNLSGDDITAVIAFTDAAGAAIGVMWSNQNDQRQYFAVHRDGEPDSAWSGETALSGPLEADDHINLKAAAGRVFAATKTSNGSDNAPLIRLLVRSPEGTWHPEVVARGDADNTRPIITLALDPSNSDIYVFMTMDRDAGIAYKRASLTNPVFSSSETVFIQGPAEEAINNATTMKGNMTASSGVVVLASDPTHYWWNSLALDGSGATNPVADFTATPTTGSAPLEVAFTDASAGTPTAWAWDFGDGSTSTDQHPSHVYTEPGTYTVSLAVSNGAGSDDITRTDHITVADATSPPTADFSGTPLNGDAPLSVAFADQSTDATSWAWDFGDGQTSTEQHPTNVYAAAGTYTVTLTATNASGTDTLTRTDYVTVGEPEPTQTFASAADSYVNSGSPTRNFGNSTTLRVRQTSSMTLRSYLQFDVSGVTGPADAVLRLWVGDGSPDGGTVHLTDAGWTERAITWNTAPALGSAVADVGSVVAGGWVEISLGEVIDGSGTYAFAVAGESSNLASYGSRQAANPPQLIIGVGGGDGSSGPSEPSEPSEPSAPVAPTAGFSATPTDGEAPLSVTFTDESTDATSWAWDFGDGQTSTDQHPTHSYVAAGTYTVELTATNDAGSDTLVRNDYVTVSEAAVEPPPDADGATFDAAADAYVNDGAPTRNFGNSSTLRVRQTSSVTLRSYLQFDVSGVTGPADAVLRLWVGDGSPDGGTVHLTDAGWTERAITWSSAPALGSEVADAGEVVAGGWVEIPLGEVVDGSGTYAFALAGESSNLASYDSRQAANPPQLIIGTSG